MTRHLVRPLLCVVAATTLACQDLPPSPLTYQCGFNGDTNWKKSHFNGSVSSPGGCPFGLDYASENFTFASQVKGTNGAFATTVPLLLELWSSIHTETVFNQSTWFQQADGSWLAEPQGVWPAGSGGFTGTKADKDSASLAQQLLTAPQAKGWVLLPYYQTPGLRVYFFGNQVPYIGTAINLNAATNSFLIPYATLKWWVDGGLISNTSPYYTANYSTAGTHSFKVTATSQTTGASQTFTRVVSWTNRK